MGTFTCWICGDPSEDSGRCAEAHPNVRPATGDRHPIKVTGTRPGEKLHEQLWNEGSKVSDTKFPGVFAVEADAVPHDFLEKLAIMEERAVARDDDGAGECLRNMPTGFAEKELRVSATSLVN